MKILIAGSWRWPIYESACADALTSLGHEIIPFSWEHYFKGSFGKMQNALSLPGPSLLKLNRALAKTTNECRPDAVLVWRGAPVFPATLKTLKKKTGATIISYNNDDPFGPQAHGNVPWSHFFLWRYHVIGLKECDICFVYRNVNIQEALAVGAKNVQVLMPYFIPAIHRPIVLSEADWAKYECDAVFVGHYESDGREQYLRSLVEAGLHVRLFGAGYWTRDVLGCLADYFGDIPPVRGDEYAKALSGAKMCLCFLSRLNRDTYTRRCFEIPACGGLLLSERTEDLRRMFKEDEEAVFFSSTEELTEKALWLRDHPKEIERIAQAGMRRVHADGHSVNGRMKEFINIVEKHAHGT